MPEIETLLRGEKDFVSALADILEIETEDIGDVILEIEKKDISTLNLLQKTALGYKDKIKEEMNGFFNLGEKDEIENLMHQIDFVLDAIVIICEQKQKILGSLDSEKPEKIEDEEDSVFVFNLRSELGIEENADIEIVDAIMEEKDFQKVVLVKIASLKESERLQTELDNAISTNNIGKIKNIRLQLDTALKIALAACIKKEELTSA